MPLSIDGEAFQELTEEYLHEVAPCLGDRIKLKKVIFGVQLNSSAVSSSNLLVVHKSIASYACIIVM